MGQVFKLLAVIWLFTACLGASFAAEGGGERIAEPTTAAPTEPPKEPTTAAPTEPPKEPTTAAPTEPPKEPTTAAPTEPPKEPTTAAPTEPPKEPTTAAPTEPPKEPTTAAPTEPPKEPTTAAPTEPPKEPTTAAPTEPPKEPTTAAPTEPPKEPTTAAPTEPPKEPTTAAPTEPPKEPTTAAPTEPPKEPTTAAPTEPPKEPTTAAPTEPPKEPTTAAPTEPPKEPTTAAPTEPPKEPTTAEPNPCEPNPCGVGSTCVPRFEDHVCLCLPGYVYSEERETCERAKVFPGELTLTTQYEPEMEDPKSEVFLTVSDSIISELKKAFESDPSYTTSTVQKLLPTSRVGSRNEIGVLAQVENIFAATSNLDATEVSDALEEAIKNSAADSVLGGAEFKEKKLCESAINPCDLGTTTCKDGAGTFTCECRDGYIATAYSDRVCIACPSGTKTEKGVCVSCPYGYSGFNCNESWKFVLTIVGSVLGILLLISVIGMIVLARKPTKKKSKKNKEKDIGNGNVSNFSAKAPLVNGSSANNQVTSLNGSTSTFGGVPKIPRAMTSSSMDRRTNLEMTPSNSRQNLVSAGRNQRLYEDTDDINPYAQTRPQANPYAQSRAQSSPYAQNRSETNPYAQTRSQTNPYAQTRSQTNPYASNQGNTNYSFTNDNGRRLY